HLKLFPRHERLRFRYRVHEQIAPAIQQLGVPFKPSRAKVIHRHADSTPEGKNRRIERNLRLLRLNLAEAPDDPVLLLHLGLTCLDVPGELPQATAALRRSLALFEPRAPVRLTAYLALAKACHCCGQ